MELLDRYLHAVASALPDAQRGDITEELRDSLLSLIEERAGKLGRPLNGTEVAQLLKQHGHPRAVAHSYLPKRDLISQPLMAHYLFALRIVFGVVLVVGIATTALTAAYAPAPLRAVGAGLGQTVQYLLLAFAALTLAALGVERLGWAQKLAEGWDPRRLPRAIAIRARSAPQLAFGIVFAAAFVIAWTGVAIGIGPASLRSIGALPESIAVTLYLPLLALVVLQVAAHLCEYLQPAWTLFHRSGDAAIRLGVLVLASIAWRNGPWIIDAAGAPHPMNGLVGMVLGIVILITAIQVAVATARLLRQLHGRASQVLPSMVA